MKKVLLSLLAGFSMSGFANDWVDFNPKNVVDLGEAKAQLDPLLQPPGKKNTSSGVTPNVVTPTWWPIAGIITAPRRSTSWYRLNFPLTPTGAWTFQTFTYTWLISGGWTNDQKNMDMMACVHYQTSWQACGDVRKTINTPEFGTSDFAVSFPVQCYLCPNPAVLSLFLKVPPNSLDPSGTRYASSPISVTFAAGSGRLHYTP